MAAINNLTWICISRSAHSAARKAVSDVLIIQIPFREGSLSIFLNRKTVFERSEHRSNVKAVTEALGISGEAMMNSGRQTVGKRQ
jgi:hypothetical protein